MITARVPVRPLPATISPPIDGAGAHGGGQEAVDLGAAAERLARDDREHDLELVGERADHGHHRERHRQRGRARHVAQALAQLAAAARRGRGSGAGRSVSSRSSDAITAT